MATELIQTKLYIPPLRPSLVPRPRLIQLLNEGLFTKRKLTLVSAPAGFGKTTLVVDWLKQIDLPTAWLSLDEADNDLQRFLVYLAAAFQQIDEEISAPLNNASQASQLQLMEKILAGLLNEIAARADPLILVLDDFHLLKEAAILEVARFLLNHQPENLHLVIMTREDPDLPLARLRARDQLTEIRAGDLRFNQAETGMFLRSVIGLALSEQDVATLEGRTEGWVVGLQLAGLSMQKQVDLKAFISDFSGSHRHILDYLTEEVIQQQPDDIRTFLLQTAVLDRLCGSLCDALTGRNDSSRVLAYLEAANLFVVPLDDERRWYRYHHLFSDLLHSQLIRSRPEWIPKLHGCASRWYTEHGDIPTAIEHALQDTDRSQAAHLIEQHTLPMLYQGQVARVVGWFDRLPEVTLALAPMLCISKAWALVLLERRAQIEAVEGALQAAEQALERVEAGEALRNQVAGHAASIRAFYLQISAFNSKQPGMLIDLAQEAQRLLPSGEKAIRAVNDLILSHAYQAQANLEATRLAFRQTLDDGLAGGNIYAAVYGPIGLANTDLLAGYLREALQLCNQYIDRFNHILAGQNFPSIGALYILKGALLLENNDLALAGRALMEGLDLLHWTEDYDAHSRGYAALARLHAIHGDFPAMLNTFKTLEENWPERTLYAQSLRHRLSLCHWPENSQVRKDAEAWLSQYGIAFDRLAVVDSVDPISQRYLESYLCTAHILAYLAKGKVVLYPARKRLLEDALAYLEREEAFAKTHEITSWVVAVEIARTLLYQAAGKKPEALKALEAALGVAAPTGLFRIFLDECDPLQSLLEELLPRLTNRDSIRFANRLILAMDCQPAKPDRADRPEAQLSEREIEVLRYLARGLTYEEIGKQLFLSLNTMQFHVKNIYGKLLVNKRVHAIEKAREMKLI